MRYPRKSVLAALTVLVLLLSLSGCGEPSPDPTTAPTVEPTIAPAPTPTPTPTPTIEPTVEPTIEPTEPPEEPEPDTAPDLILSAEDGVLPQGGPVILEPDTAPFNIGGWQSGHTVIWPNMSIPKNGMYQISFEYSRDYTDTPVHGTMTLLFPNDETEIPFTIEPTSETVGDWSIYTLESVAELSLDRGPFSLTITPGTVDNPLPDGVHLMNLRSIQFTATAIHEETPVFDQLTAEERITLLKYDAYDFGSPWSAYDPDTCLAFYSWYAAEWYGVDISVEDMEKAIQQGNEEGSSEAPRFELICKAYNLFPSREMQESGSFWTNPEPGEYGDNPVKAKDDT